MRYDPLKHHRRSTRLRGFDYTLPGTYFITVCVHGGIEALGTLIEDEARVRYRWCGNIVAVEWEQLSCKYAHVTLGEYVVMPDHFHAVLRFAPLEECPMPRASLGDVLGFWKYQTTRLINEARMARWGQAPVKVWQRGFYDRIVRTETELEFVRQYILDNPRRASDM